MNIKVEEEEEDGLGGFLPDASPLLSNSDISMTDAPPPPPVNEWDVPMPSVEFDEDIPGQQSRKRAPGIHQHQYPVDFTGEARQPRRLKKIRLGHAPVKLEPTISLPLASTGGMVKMEIKVEHPPEEEEVRFPYAILFTGQDGSHDIMVRKFGSTAGECTTICYHVESGELRVRKAKRKRLTRQEMEEGDTEIKAISFLRKLPTPLAFRPAVWNLHSWEYKETSASELTPFHLETYWDFMNLGTLFDVHMRYDRNNGEGQWNYFPRVIIASPVVQICRTLEWMYTASDQPLLHCAISLRNIGCHWPDGDELPTAMLINFEKSRPLWGHDGVLDVRESSSQDVEALLSCVEQLTITPRLGLRTRDHLYEKPHELQGLLGALKAWLALAKPPAKTDRVTGIPSLEAVVEVATTTLHELASRMSLHEARSMKDPLKVGMETLAPEVPYLCRTPEDVLAICQVPGPFSVIDIHGPGIGQFTVVSEGHSRPDDYVRGPDSEAEN